MHHKELKQTSAQYMEAVHNLHSTTSGIITESKYIGSSWDSSIEGVKENLETLKNVTHTGIARAIGFKIENKENENLEEETSAGDGVNWRQSAQIFKKSMISCTKDLLYITLNE